MDKHEEELRMLLAMNIGDDYDEAFALLDAVLAKPTDEAVREAISFIEGGYGDVWKWRNERTQTIIKALEAYQPWISMDDDRKPSHNQECLINIADVGVWVDTFKYYSEGVNDFDRGYWQEHGSTVTHWMPLPKPPKGE